SSISINRNLTNNPLTNSQGSGLATLLLGYTTGGARGFLLEPYFMTNVEHAAFVQDDWKVSPRITANVGLRWEYYGADTEDQDRLVNYDPGGMKLIYAGEDGASRTVDKKGRNNLAPRLGLAWDLRGDSRHIVRAGYGISYYPLAQSASNLLGQQVPYTISQNYSVETNPSDFSRVPLLSNPFPAITQIKPRTTAELNAANPRVLGH